MITGVESAVLKGGSAEAFKWIGTAFSKWLDERRSDQSKREAAGQVVQCLQQSAVNGYERLSYISSIALPRLRAPLNEIYVNLTLTVYKEGVEFEIDGFPDSLFRKSANKVLVVDSAGAGKSTISKRIYTRALDEKKLVPILIDLRRFRDVTDIFSLICRDLMIDIANRDVLISIVESEHFLFILDGFDEIPEQNKGNAANAIRAFVDKARESCFLLTSRPEIGISAFSDFQRYSIKPLKTNQAYELLSKLDGNSDVSKRLIEKLRNEKNEAINSFLENPLLTSLLYKAFEYKTTIPLKKNVFYRQVFDALFESHDLTKEPGFTREKYTRLHVDDFHRVLRAIAAVFHNRGVTETTKDEFIGIATEASKYCRDLEIKPSDFLKDLLGPVPLFVEDGIYVRWSHKSLLDYFLAEFFVRDFEGDKGAMLKTVLDNDNPERFENFIEILYEIDPIVVTTFLVLPLFERIIHRMREIELLVARTLSGSQRTMVVSLMTCYEVIVVRDKKLQAEVSSSTKSFLERVSTTMAAAGVDPKIYRPRSITYTVGAEGFCCVSLIQRKLSAVLIVQRLKNLPSLNFSDVAMDLRNHAISPPEKLRRQKAFGVARTRWLYAPRSRTLERLSYLLNTCHLDGQRFVDISGVPRMYELIQTDMKDALKTRESFRL